MSIRRDLDALVDSGHAIRTHGGAVEMPAGLVAFRFSDDRAGMAIQRKQASAEVAEIAGAMAGATDRAVALFDSAKFGHPALMRYARWPDIDVVGSADGLAGAERDFLAKHVGQVPTVTQK